MRANKTNEQNKKTLVSLDTDTEAIKLSSFYNIYIYDKKEINHLWLPILSSRIYAITFDDVLVIRRGIVSVSVSRYFRQVSYRSHSFGIVTTLVRSEVIPEEGSLRGKSPPAKLLNITLESVMYKLEYMV